jgi:hypothetical protein
MNNLDAIYDFILNELRKLTLNENFYFKPIKPKLSDLELIAINISAEYLSLDSEYQLFRYLSNSKLKGMIERSVYNRRKRKLFFLLVWLVWLVLMVLGDDYGEKILSSQKTQATPAFSRFASPGPSSSKAMTMMVDGLMD